ncbi:darcynin family protein [Sulfitobacter sp. LCG007]
MKITLFLLLKAAPSWLRLSRAARREISEAALAAVLGKGDVTFRHFDAEAFHAQISDVAMIEADTADAAYFTIERLRDSALIADEFFSVEGIIPCFENGFRQFEAQAAAAADAA